jgi:hypothetical protein
MATSVVQQFGHMLASRWNLGKESQPKTSKPPIHETVTYPRIKVTSYNDSCLIPSMAYEHILACGHIITTALPDLPCAPNCHHVANIQMPKQRGHRNGVKNEGEGRLFYCDACAEAKYEDLIPDDATATAAGKLPPFSYFTSRADAVGTEKFRAEMRVEEAMRRGKATNYRKCYIGLKVTSVPCYSDGKVSRRYVPRKEHHPFDISIPQTGDNFFEDMLVDPPSDTEVASEESATPPGSPTVVDSPVSLGEAGANYLKYSKFIAGDDTAVRSTKSPRITFKALKQPGRSALSKATTNKPPVVPNAKSTTPVVSPKRQIVEYVDDEYEETEVEEEVRPVKRRKATPNTTTPKRASVEKTATPVRRRSTRGSVTEKSA